MLLSSVHFYFLNLQGIYLLSTFTSLLYDASILFLPLLPRSTMSLSFSKFYFFTLQGLYLLSTFTSLLYDVSI